MRTSPRAKPLLVIIDGYSLLFRAFFAPGPYLSTSSGLPTGALFGFSTSLLMVLEQEKPDAIYVAWDPPGKSFRSDSYEAYKAQRPEAGDDLKRQLPIARQIVQTFGIASVEVPRFEADDLIGTLAAHGVKEGYQALVVTGDTDELQLVGDHVKVRMVRRGLTETKLYDEAAVVERYGIPPARIPDYKALVGDTSDNIPGVPGIGDKTATKLLQQFGSLDGLLAHLEELPPGRVRDSLVRAADQPLASRELATIHCDAPFEGAIQTYRPDQRCWARVRALFEELEFRSLLRRLPEPEPEIGLPEQPGAEPEIERAVIRSAEQLREALDEAVRAGTVSFQLLTDTRVPVRAAIHGIGFAATPDRGYFVSIEPENGARAELIDAESVERAYEATLADFAPLLSGTAIRRYTHNAKFAEIVLRRHGSEVDRFSFDTMVAAYLLAPGRSAYPLPEIAQEHLGVRADRADTLAPHDRAAHESALIAGLVEPLAERLKSQDLNEIMARVEMPLAHVLAEMERVGVPVDPGWLEQLSETLDGKIKALERRIFELAEEEFVIGSTQQLQRILFEKLGLPTGRKIKTGYSTGADLLETLARDYEICARILEYRELTKLKGTYADALPRLVNPQTGRLHTSLNQTVAATGRLSSSDPNLQNIPIRTEVGREIRKAFAAPQGQLLLSCDYSQIELRVFAHVTKDAEMLRAFEADEDIHAATAAHLFSVDLRGVTPEMRRRAKTVNFAVIYGQGDFGLANTLGIPTADARAFIERYFAQFPGVKRYTRQTLEFARARGYVRTLLGRRRYLPEIKSGNINIRQAAERAAVNMPIQGTAADIIKLAMIDVHDHLGAMCYNCVLLLQVHDELVFGVEEDLVARVTPEIVERMESAYRLDVRLKVDAKVGRNWAEMRSIAS